MKKFALLTLLFCLLLLPLAAAHGQEPNPEAMLHLQAATFDPLRQGEPALSIEAAVQASSVPMPASPYHIVQFSGPVEAIWVQQVEALGGQVFGYVPDNAHIVRMTPAVAAKVSTLGSVRWVGAYRPGYKLATDLAQGFGTVSASNADLDLTVMGFTGESLDALKTFLRQQGATILDAGDAGFGPILIVRTPGYALTTILQHPAISWVERYIEPAIANAEGRKIMGAEAIWQDFGYFGSGQIVAVSDSGLSVQGAISQDFGDRVIRAFAPSEMNIRPDCRAKTTFTDLHGHGTHVAGSVLGAGVLSGGTPASHLYTSSHAGIAPEARLVFMALNTDGSSSIQCIDPNGDFLAKGYELGARISTNSWGNDDAGSYSNMSSLVDNYIWNHKDYLVLYSAGNAGRGGNQTVGSPGTSKNVLTVGATENNRPDRGADSDDPDTVTNFSSRGPTADGRLKPDVVAPGSYILSVRAPQAPIDNFWEPFDQNYAYMGGTSMATPLTAGSAALVREWLGKVRGIPTPSAALMKAVLINGATQLPAEPTLSLNSGHGRVSLKNTLNAQYAIMDDFVQGLTTNESSSYTITVVANTAAGTLIAADAALQTGEVRAAAVDSMTIVDAPPAVAANGPAADPNGFTAAALPGHEAARQVTPIGKTTDLNKENQTPLTNPAPGLADQVAATGQAAAFTAGFAAAHLNNFQFNIVGGGNFEEPGWSSIWSQVWLGLGIPEITDHPDAVISGAQSMWLGGHEGEDSIWYPVHFPDKLATDLPSGIEFALRIVNGNPGDEFCAALTDVSGYFIGPYAVDGPACANQDGDYTYTKEFTPAELATLVGQTGYLVLYTISDGVEPNMSAFVDDIALYYDLPNVEATILPQSGPPGTTFLLTGKYNSPYLQVDVCIRPCSQETYIKSAYADAQGTVAIYLYSANDIAPRSYEIETSDAYGRTGHATLTISGGGNPTLSVSPQSGPAGTEFTFSGSDFIPNDAEIAVTLNGQPAGTVGSNANGEVGFSLTTRTNTPPGEYTLALTDNGARSASVEFTIQAVADDAPTLTVTPASGPQGTEFAFVAANFVAETTADVLLDGQIIGQATTNAAGGLQISLRTTADTAPGIYTLGVQQGNSQASAQFEVTQAGGGGGGGGTPQSGNGLYVTLVWTDPPAQAFANRALVNNLDLIVQTPNGQTLFGNGGNQADTLNNVETIRLENPVAGNYVVTVRATSVNGSFGAQPYAVVATTKQNFATNVSNVDLSGQTVQPTPTPVTQTLSSLSGFIYSDINRNGRRDAGERGIAHALVLVTPSQGGPTTQTTADNTGAYSVQDLPIGQYRVQVVLPGFTFTTSNSVLREVEANAVATVNIGAVSQALIPLVRK